MDPSASDTEPNNKDESMEENNQCSLRNSSGSLRNKTPREATKKFHKLINHIANDEDIIENLPFVSSVISDPKSKQFSLSNFVVPTHRGLLSNFNRSIPKGDSYINIPNVHIKILQKNTKENVTIDTSMEMMKFLNIGLETYLKNSLEKLIQINRRRTSYSLPYSEINRKVTIKTHDFKTEISVTKPYQKKVDFIPHKNFSIFYTRNINQNIAFIERYKELLYKNKVRKEKIATVEAGNNQSSALNSIDKKKIMNNNPTEIDCCIYNNNDITRNSKPKLNRRRNIELKDLITFLDNEKRTPFQRVLLYKAYILLTTPNKKK